MRYDEDVSHDQDVYDDDDNKDLILDPDKSDHFVNSSAMV